MPTFANTEQFYTCASALFARVGNEDPNAADSIRNARLIIRLRLTAPSAEVTINGRHNPVQTTLGPSKLHPDLDIEMAADTLHRILLGELGLRKALGDRLLKVRGPILKALVLADLFHHLQALYPQILREQELMG